MVDNLKFNATSITNMKFIWAGNQTGYYLWVVAAQGKQVEGVIYWYVQVQQEGFEETRDQ